MATSTRVVEIPTEIDPVSVLGVADEVLRLIEEEFTDIKIVVRGNRIIVSVDSKQAVSQASYVCDLLETLIQEAYTAPVDAQTVHKMLNQQVLRNSIREQKREQLLPHVNKTQNDSHKKPRVPGVITYASGVPVRPKTAGQISYINAIEKNTITFGIGPAGTGKTYLAVAKAVQYFLDNRIQRIILTRPAVEAGENLGFLPGTLNEKVDPYLRPLYDALSDMLGADQLRKSLDDGSIEVAPLAYMRGRTLNDAFVILDEAQNTTTQQMKMFLTRLGFNTKMVITGDITQIDLAVPNSGLASIERILHDVSDISFTHLQAQDVVRHELVGRIVQAYDTYAEKHQQTEKKRNFKHEVYDKQQQNSEQH